jgi:hypothetical protein
VPDTAGEKLGTTPLLVSGSENVIVTVVLALTSMAS